MKLLLAICHMLQVVTSSSPIHLLMTGSELRRVFHVDDVTNVPEYEVVHIHSQPQPHARVKKSTDGSELSAKSKQLLQLEAFGKKYKLNLIQTELGGSSRKSVPVYAAWANSTGHLNYELVEHEEPLGVTYQDLDNQAALLVHEDEDGSILYEGTIGHDLVVRPLPQAVKKKMDSNFVQTKNKHVVFVNPLGHSNGEDEGDPLSASAPGAQAHPLGDYALMEPSDEAFSLGRKGRSRRYKRSRRLRREAPYVIYPEILVIVDYDGYRLHGGDNVQIKRYFISFWNGVDLRYKLLKGPKVRISIAGIIISRGRDATPYLERNRVGRDAIDSAAALTDMGKYLFRERRLPVYDIAVAITKYDMCRRRKGGRCTKGTAGFAYVGGACVVNKRLEKVNSVAIIEDTGGFSGIIVAAHEVGHLLGAVHDGSPPPTYLGGPGAENCRWEDGYIMSDLRHTEKGFRWSPCSVASFHHFLNGETATCLFNSPHEDESLPRVLPGKLLSLDAQCRRDRGTSACFKDERVCAQLFCFDSNSGYCVAYRPAAEGSSCGDGQTCNSGRCIVEHENIIPDYSQHTVSYIRRSDTNLTTTPRVWVTSTEKTQATPSSYGESDCQDKLTECDRFVVRYSRTYCGTEYLKRNCCKSAKLCV